MGRAMGLHDGDGLLEFAQACHVEPHERGATVGEHGGLAFMADGHPRHRPAVMPKRRDVPHEPSPKHAPHLQQPQVHQYQYSFWARL